MQDHVFLLTGATGGTGQAIARALARQGARLVLTGRDGARLHALVAALEADGARARGVACDLLSASAPQRLIEEAVAWGGRLDGLVLCAGGARFTFFSRLAPEEFDDALRLNLTANVALVRCALPHLQARARSWIVFINTIAAREPTPPRGTSYLTAKAGLLHFAEGLFSEIRDTGVHVTSILPDLIDTSMVPDVRKLDRDTLIRPESVAAAVVYALSATPDVCVAEIHLRPQPSLRTL